MEAFLSYASERRQDAQKVLAAARGWGLTVFFDRDSIVAGQAWKRAIDAALKRADIVFLLFSPESQSKTGVLQEEIKDILTVAKRRPLGDIYIIVFRTKQLQLPPELEHLQYIDLFSKDWMLQFAHALQLKFAQTKRKLPTHLKHFLGKQQSEQIAHTLRRKGRGISLAADYFTYDRSGRFWDYINAEIIATVCREFYENEFYARSNDRRTQWSLRLDEVFRDGDFVSLRIFHYTDYGGAHPSYGITTMNFGGEQLGRFAITDLLDTGQETLKFVQQFCEAEMNRGHADEDGHAASDLLDMYVKDKWEIFEQFSFDAAALTINLSAFAGLPHVMGVHSIRIPWDQFWRRINPNFVTTKLARRLGLRNAYAPSG